MLLIPYNLAHVATVSLPQRADASPTWELQDEGGAVLSSGTCTLATSNTTLAAGVAAGAFTLTVASASGISAGSKYLLGGPETAGGETLTVRSVSGTTVTLLRPTIRERASGVAFQSTEATCSLSATTSVGRDRRLVVSWEVSGTDQPPLVVPACVTRWYPHTGLTMDSFADLDPIARKRWPAGLWFSALSARAWDMLLAHTAANLDPGAPVGTIELTTAHHYLVRALLLETAGPEYRDDYKTAIDRYKAERDAALTLIGVDNDQDGNVEPHEGYFRTIPLSRG